MSIGIYKITNILNGKSYVGQSINIEKRLNRHRNGYDSNMLISSAIKKYGVSNFKFDILEECAILELNKREVALILLYNSMCPFGYNLSSGGGAGQFVSEETKYKISVAGKGRVISNDTKIKMAIAATGRVHTEDTKLKLSIINKGNVPTIETRNKISIANAGRVFSEEAKLAMSLGRTGIFPSEEAKVRMSKAHLGTTMLESTKRKISIRITGLSRSAFTREKMSIAKKNQSHEYKKVTVFRSDGIIFSSILEAADISKVDRKTVYNLIKTGSVGKCGFSFKLSRGVSV